MYFIAKGKHVQRHIRVNNKITKHFVEKRKKYNHMHVNKNKMNNLLLQSHAWFNSRFISLTLHVKVSPRLMKLYSKSFQNQSELYFSLHQFHNLQNYLN